MLSEKLLKQVAEEFALAMNESLPKPEQCQHQFSEEFERKMQLPCPLLILHFVIFYIKTNETERHLCHPVSFPGVF